MILGFIQMKNKGKIYRLDPRTFVDIILSLGVLMRFLMFVVACLFSLNSFALTQYRNVKPVTVLSAATSTGAGSAFLDMPPEKSCQGYGTTSVGTGASVILIQVSNDGTNWATAGTITLTLGTSATNDGFAMNATWKELRANVSSISGTNASVNVICSFKLKE